MILVSPVKGLAFDRMAHFVNIQLISNFDRSISTLSFHVAY